MPFTKQHSAYAWVVTCILFLINLTFHNLPLHSSYKIHQPITDYFLRLPYSELLEKRLFRSRANRRLVGEEIRRLPAVWHRRDERDPPGKAAERWSGFGGQLDAARPRGRSALGGLGPHGRTRRVECALARPSWCAPCGRSRTISDAAVPFRGVCPTDCHIWFGMDTNETTRQHRRANAWRDNDGGGRRLSVQFCTVLTSPDVLAALIVDSLWEDMSEAGQRIFFQLSSHDWLNVGRHEWRRPPHLLLAAGPMVDSMWESWGRDGQIKTVRDMCRVCPTAGRSATGLARLWITAKRWQFVQQTELYRFCACCFDS